MVGHAAMHLPINRDFIVQTLIDLVRTNSINPSIAPDGPGERAISTRIAALLGGLGLETGLHEPEPGRTSALCVWRGTGGGRSLMLNGHVDTVGVEGMPDPFAGAIRDGRVYGRGAHDMKGSLAACIGAIRALVDGGIRLRGDLVLAAVADEEYGSLGTSDVLTRCRVDGAIVTEPTNLDICLAHKGYAWIEVETVGRAAHGSRFAEGVDANMRMGRFLAELDRHERDLRLGRAHPLVGPPSLHAAMLQGGSGLSTYASRCRLTVERRTVPGETVADAVAPLEAIVRRLRESDPGFDASLSVRFAREPFEAPTESPVVQALAAAAAAVLPSPPALVGDTPWMDSALLAAAGIDTVVMGPTGAGEHSSEEWVEIESVVRMAEILARAVIAYCG
jgi:acetylornithine deacetylase